MNELITLSKNLGTAKEIGWRDSSSFQSAPRERSAPVNIASLQARFTATLLSMRRVVVVAVAWAWVGCGGIVERKPDEQAGGSSNTGAGTAGAPSIAGTATMKPAVQGTASGDPCYNDSDCPDAACGGEICNWNKQNPNPIGEKVFVCENPGNAPKGQEGWCTTDADCKCQVLGARCIGVYCSFTQPGDTP